MTKDRREWADCTGRSVRLKSGDTKEDEEVEERQAPGEAAGAKQVIMTVGRWAGAMLPGRERRPGVMELNVANCSGEHFYRSMALMPSPTA